MKQTQQEQQLRDLGLRATPKRIAVLSTLEEQSFPIGIASLEKKHSEIDRVSLYRMMEQFEEKGIVKSYDIGHGHRDYELADRDHHHHLVCKGCGKIEDVNFCGLDELKQMIKSKSNFAEVDEHEVLFKGTCKSCQ